MFRTTLLAVRRVPATPFRVARSFHTSPVVWAKVKKTKAKKKEEGEQVEVSDLIDFSRATSKFQGVLDAFTKQANEIKMGKTSPTIFNKLKVTTSDGEQPFTSLAQTSLKGRKLIITVFDPAHTKDLVNAVLDLDLNLNPQVDPHNKQALHVPLPPVTTETKKENAKQLKGVFEKYKSGPNSLNSVRTDFRGKAGKVTKKNKLSDAENKVLADFEKLHKTYVDKLTDIYKAAESAITK